MLLPYFNNRKQFSRVAVLAKNVLCVPATSVPCERLFSSAGYIVNKRRSALAPHTVNNHACLPSGLALLTLSFRNCRNS